MHVYEIRPRKDRRGFDLISDALQAISLCMLPIRTRMRFLSALCERRHQEFSQHAKDSRIHPRRHSRSFLRTPFIPSLFELFSSLLSRFFALFLEIRSCIPDKRRLCAIGLLRRFLNPLRTRHVFYVLALFVFGIVMRKVRTRTVFIEFRFFQCYLVFRSAPTRFNSRTPPL